MDICWKHSSTSYKALGRKKFPLNKHKKAINTTITAKVHPSLGPGVQRSQKNLALHVQSTKGYSKSKTATYHNSIDPWPERTPHHD